MRHENIFQKAGNFSMPPFLKRTVILVFGFLIRGIFRAIFWAAFFLFPLILSHEWLGKMVRDEVSKVRTSPAPVSHAVLTGGTERTQERARLFDYRSAFSNFRSWFREFERWRK
ncbi:MAG: hypothetical protein HZC17_00110 [Candidatus Omnitrophica bacterium]|nr:hypothetical protein [Candidatus Omnitrophota bacterium]